MTSGPGLILFSDENDQIAAAMVDALSELEDLQKERQADTGKYKYNYADLADAYEEVRPKLKAHGLIAIQVASGDGATVSAGTLILHRSGQWVWFSPLVLRAGDSPQQAGSALTYARRYSLLPALGLATADDDGQKARKGGNEQADSAAQSTGSAPRRPSGSSAPPTNRTEAEAEIRAILAALSGGDVQQIQASFRDHFGMPLSRLPVERHEEALDYVRWLADSSDTTPDPDPEPAQ